MADTTKHTYLARLRIPLTMWQAYGRITDRMGTDRTARLLDHIRADFKGHGDEQDLADLAAAEQELAERRARKGGRPKKEQTA